MIAQDSTPLWLTGIAFIGLAAAIAAGSLLWMVLTQPIAVIHWADKL